MCEYNDRLLAVAWWVILNSPGLLYLWSYFYFHASFLGQAGKVARSGVGVFDHLGENISEFTSPSVQVLQIFKRNTSCVINDPIGQTHNKRKKYVKFLP